MSAMHVYFPVRRPLHPNKATPGTGFGSQPDRDEAIGVNYRNLPRPAVKAVKRAVIVRNAFLFYEGSTRALRVTCAFPRVPV